MGNGKILNTRSRFEEANALMMGLNLRFNPISMDNAKHAKNFRQTLGPLPNMTRFMKPIGFKCEDGELKASDLSLRKRGTLSHEPIASERWIAYIE